MPPVEIDPASFDSFFDDGKPPDKIITCGLCKRPLKVSHYLIAGRWLHPSCHDSCAEAYEARLQQRKPVEIKMPPRFLEKFDLTKFKYPRLIADATEFTHESKFKCLAVVGPPRQGKSRLVWQTVQGFFTMLEHQTGVRAWPEYTVFPDLVSELDRPLLNRLRIAKYVFIDDIGSCESFGSTRASAQQLVRSRIERNQWLFLTADDLDGFDRGLEGFLVSRAVLIVLAP